LKSLEGGKNRIAFSNMERLFGALDASARHFITISKEY